MNKIIHCHLTIFMAILSLGLQGCASNIYKPDSWVHPGSSDWNADFAYCLKKSQLNLLEKFKVGGIGWMAESRKRRLTSSLSERYARLLDADAGANMDAEKLLAALDFTSLLRASGSKAAAEKKITKRKFSQCMGMKGWHRT